VITLNFFSFLIVLKFSWYFYFFAFTLEYNSYLTYFPIFRYLASLVQKKFPIIYLFFNTKYDL